MICFRLFINGIIQGRKEWEIICAFREKLSQRQLRISHGTGITFGDAGDTTLPSINLGDALVVNWVSEFISFISTIANIEIILNIKYFTPNPANDAAVLQIIDATGQRADVDIYNLFGQKVLSISQQLNKGKNDLNFDLRNMTSGVYLAVVSTPTNKATGKLEIMK